MLPALLIFFVTELHIYKEYAQYPLRRPGNVIASIAFGLEANSFTNPQNEFRKAGLSVTDISLRRVVDAISIFFIPKLSPLVKAKLFPPIAENAFRRIFSYTIKNRRESGLFRNDLVDILIAFQDASKNGETEIEFTDD
uniref:Cytochrome P450 n=1 Tax=Megaselia scalaris TaxID=36166 RepID=T1GZC0_MEGSC